MRRARGMTLMEILMVVIALAVVAALAIPQFTGAMERSYERFAREQLELLYTAERVYLFENGTYCDPAVTPGCLNIDDPNAAAGNNNIPVTFTIALTGPPPGFTATATRGGGGGQNLVITNTGTITDNWP